MARPKKEVAAAAGSTRERILTAAIGLFSQRGYDGVSIREIARENGLNEASLYNYFPGKAALLDAVLDRLVEKLVEPGLADLSDEELAGKSLEEAVLGGSARFFGAADDEAMRIWRILMMEQYRNERARDFLRERVLAQPRAHLTRMLEAFARRGRLREGVEPAAAAACLASVFFELSFTANLAAGWGQIAVEEPLRLHDSVRLLCRSFEATAG